MSTVLGVTEKDEWLQTIIEAILVVLVCILSFHLCQGACAYRSASTRILIFCTCVWATCCTTYY